MRRIRSRKLLFAIVLLAFILRFFLLLKNPEFNYDELVVYKNSRLPVTQLLAGNYYQFAFHPPFYYLLVKLWSVLGTSELWLRLPSFLLSLSAVVAAYKFSPQLSLILAFSAFHISWASQLRVYSWMQFISLLFTYVFLKFRTRKSYPYLLALLGLVAFSVDYSFIWLLLSLGLYLFAVPFPGKKKVIKPLATMFFLILPVVFLYAYKIVIFARTSYAEQSLWIDKPDFSRLLSTLSEFLSGRNFETAVLLPPAVFLLLLGLYLKESVQTPAFFMFSVPLLASFAVSQFLPIFETRNLYISALGAYWLLSCLIIKAKKWQFLLLLILFAANFVSYLEAAATPKEMSWSHYVAYLNRLHGENMEIAFYPAAYYEGLSYYGEKYGLKNNFSEISYPKNTDFAAFGRVLADAGMSDCFLIKNTPDDMVRTVSGFLGNYEKADFGELSSFCRKQVAL